MATSLLHDLYFCNWTRQHRNFIRDWKIKSLGIIRMHTGSEPNTAYLTYNHY